VIWGGVGQQRGPDDFNMLGDGWAYDPALDAWRALPAEGAPSPRAGFVMLWTGSEVLVYGGADSTYGFRDITFSGTGARYSPDRNNWLPMSIDGAPAFRCPGAAVWSGSELLVWGNVTEDGGPPATNGGRYDPAADRWRPLSLDGAPDCQCLPLSSWTGSEMLVWGGTTFCDNEADTSGARYDPAADRWQPMSNEGAPRLGGAAVWAGDEWLVFDNGQESLGSDEPTAHAYEPSADRWRPLAPTPYALWGMYSVVWAGSQAILWGGLNLEGPVALGALYEPAADAWTTASLVGAPPGSMNHAAIWTGTEMIIWGGTVNGETASATGGRFELPVQR